MVLKVYKVKKTLSSDGFPTRYFNETEEVVKKEDVLTALKLKDEEWRNVVEPLVRENKNIMGWLSRMSKLNWDDPDYAPNFKAVFVRLQKALEDYEKKVGEK